jgi:RNA polymerase sigma factor (sigma-70 family)
VSSLSQDKDFQDLLARISQGDEDACREVVDRHSAILRTVVRRRLNRQVRRLVDPIDLVQDTWIAFFGYLRRGKTFVGREQLLAFLLNVARNKTLEANRHHLECRKRDVRRVLPLGTVDPTAEETLLARDPAPVNLLIAEETWERLLMGRRPVQQLVLAYRRAGHTHREVADASGLHEKTVRRLLQHVLGGVRTATA